MSSYVQWETDLTCSIKSPKRNGEALVYSVWERVYIVCAWLEIGTTAEGNGTFDENSMQRRIEMKYQIDVSCYYKQFMSSCLS